MVDHRDVVIPESVDEMDRLQIGNNWEELEKVCRARWKKLSASDRRAAAGVLLQVRLAVAYTGMSRLPDAESILSEIEPLVRKSGSEELKARWHFATCRLFYRSGDFRAVRKHARLALASLDLPSEGDPWMRKWLRIAAIGNLALVDMHDGNYSSAQKSFRTAIRLSEEIGLASMKLQSQINLAWAYVLAGNFEEARQIAEQSHKHAAGKGEIWNAVRAAVVLGTIARLSGKTEEAWTYLVEVRRETEKGNPRRERALADELEADLECDANNYSRAGELYLRAIEFGLASGLKDVVAENRRKFADLRLRQGQLQEARALATSALSLADEGGTVQEMVASRRVLACVSDALRYRSAARALAQEALDLLPSSDLRYERVLTLLATAHFMDNPKALLEEARTLADDLHLTNLVDEARRRLAELEVVIKSHRDASEDMAHEQESASDLLAPGIPFRKWTKE